MWPEADVVSCVQSFFEVFHAHPYSRRLRHLLGSLAQLVRAQGHRVTGSDQNVYPPMSDQLSAAGIELIQGYDPAQLEPAPDLW